MNETSASPPVTTASPLSTSVGLDVNVAQVERRRRLRQDRQYLRASTLERRLVDCARAFELGQSGIVAQHDRPLAGESAECTARIEIESILNRYRRRRN